MTPIKSRFARKAVKSTARHTAHGTASKFKREPFRASTLLALGGLIGVVIGRTLGGRAAPAAPSPQS
jgi:hypothetical protein